jgi:GTP-binding protein
MRTGCATLVALNKWDLRKHADPLGGGAEEAAGEYLKDAKARLAKRIRQRPPVIACSATTGRGVPKLLEHAIALADRRGERIATPELNRFVADVVAAHPPPQRHGKRLRLYYAAQIDRRPPRFAIQINDRRLITRDWAYHLENRMREHYGLEGVPLVIDFVPRKHRARKGDPAAV